MDALTSSLPESALQFEVVNLPNSKVKIVTIHGLYHVLVAYDHVCWEFLLLIMHKMGVRPMVEVDSIFSCLRLCHRSW